MSRVDEAIDILLFFGSSEFRSTWRSEKWHWMISVFILEWTAVVLSSCA